MHHQLLLDLLAGQAAHERLDQMWALGVVLSWVGDLEFAHFLCGVDVDLLVLGLPGGEES